MYTRRNKFGNTKTNIDGRIFDSKAEGRRYAELKILADAGEITQLECQVPYLLIPTFKHNGQTHRCTKYIADFQYRQNGKVIVEDVKSDFTRKDPIYRLKKKLLLHLYPDIHFQEIIM